MATKLDPNELVTFKELLLSNSIQIDAAVQLLIDKGLITEQEFFTKLKQVQAQYQAKRNG
jgi:mannitol/fructose-specific phosphotransferase system IIA component (Ntr-type)